MLANFGLLTISINPVMVIHDAHMTINALRKALPECFVFVLDTTDRSFIYKSDNNKDYERLVLAFDREKGMDQVLRESNFYFGSIDNNFFGVKNLSSHTFIGFCMASDQNENADLLRAEQIIKA